MFRPGGAEFNSTYSGALSHRMFRRDFLKRASTIGLSFALGSTLLAACGGNDESDDENGEEPTTAPTSADTSDEPTQDPAANATDLPTGDSTSEGAVGPFDRPDRTQLASPQRFIFGSGRDPETLDLNVGASGWIWRAVGPVYETLVIQDLEFQFVPSLARSWSISDDATEFTFELRDDVKFHDGTEFNAEAVKFAFDRIADPATESRRAAGLIGPYVSSEVVDPYTVTIRLENPYVPFLEGICQAFVGIPSPTAVQELGDSFGLQPVGSGPLKFKEWLPRESITLERFEDYAWAPEFFNLDGPPYLDEMVVRIVLEDGVRTGVLESGEVHLIDYLQPSDVARLQNNSDLDVIIEIPPGMSQMYNMNVTWAPLDDINVRKALIHAVDRPFFNESTAFGLSAPAYGPLAQGSFAYNEELESMYPFDPELSQSLLEEAGWVMGSDGICEKDGKALELELLVLETPSPRDELLQAVLKDIGVALTFTGGTNAFRLERMATGDYHMEVSGLTGADPHHVLYSCFHSDNVGTPLNRSHFSNDHVDELIDQGVQMLDMDERAKIYREIQQIVMDNALIIPTYENIWLMAKSKKVHNYVLDVRQNYPYIHPVYLTK